MAQQTAGPEALPRTARFLVWHNGAPVRLKVPQGEGIQYRSGGRDAEGYRWETHLFQFDGETVRHEWHIASKDCDGPHRSGGVECCPLWELEGRAVAERRARTRGVTVEILRWPKWRMREGYQEDVFAQLARY